MKDQTILFTLTLLLKQVGKQAMVNDRLQQWRKCERTCVEMVDRSVENG